MNQSTAVCCTDVECVTVILNSPYGHLCLNKVGAPLKKTPLQVAEFFQSDNFKNNNRVMDLL